jgi:hypothetical protein
VVTHDAHSSQPHHPGVRSLSLSRTLRTSLAFGPLFLFLLSSILPAAYFFGEDGVIDLPLSGVRQNGECVFDFLKCRSSNILLTDVPVRMLLHRGFPVRPLDLGGLRKKCFFTEWPS